MELGRSSKGAGRHLRSKLDYTQAAIRDAVPCSPSLPLCLLGSSVGAPAETQVWRVPGAPVQTRRSSQQRQGTQEDRPGAPGSCFFLCLHRQVSVNREVSPLISGYGSPDLRSLSDLSLTSLLHSLSNQPLSPVNSVS